jgi:hypothetical protein
MGRYINETSVENEPMKSHSVQKLADKPVIIITLTNPTKTQHAQQTLRQIDACEGANTVYLIYDVTPLKVSSDELSTLICGIQADLLAEGSEPQLRFMIVASPRLAERLAEYEADEETDFAFFTSLDQALTYTTSRLISSNGHTH